MGKKNVFSASYWLKVILVIMTKFGLFVMITIMTHVMVMNILMTVMMMMRQYNDIIPVGEQKP